MMPFLIAENIQDVCSTQRRYILQTKPREILYVVECNGGDYHE
jgi:hypothetical protein